VKPVALLPLFVCLSAAPSLAASGGTPGAPFDGKTNLVCTVQQLFECDSYAGCRAVGEDVAFPIRHLDVDVGKRTIKIEHLDADLTSPITTSEVVEGKLLLQGTDSGIKGETGGGGYTLSINQAYGNMILTVAGQDVAFVGMGGCIAKR
jgi:hypothetical protein